ncbi:GNAT family N-acetyltransferase [Neobacillus sp. PS3-34]|uniref:GNAT family N-acetyltransferase n=1 Tax=Neobacillus sp. PS3-34 TaxID=3070678 RepID=UPI0027DF6F2F|nr:GNAT family N-acetyltransferase [Neobacillus sp. PS3-34]WML48029.1 GNAT family N-acetyltransferase [Neobacillus sp. PS3-34]
MNIVQLAKIDNLKELKTIDKLVLGNTSREFYIQKAIEKSRCFVASSAGVTAGFLTFDTNFFDHCFISLVIVHPLERRKGLASSLIKHFEKVAPTEKIF